jgi:hypothetical protein
VRLAVMILARWCTNECAGRIFLSRPVESSDPGGRRHAECRHPVENVAPDFCFGPLIGQSPGIKAPADDGLVAKHRGLDQTPSIVTRTTLPAHTTMLFDRCNV